MKRNFTQPFLRGKIVQVFILAEDVETGNFLICRSFDEDEENDGYYSEEYTYIPKIGFGRNDDLAQLIAKSLFSYGFVLQSFREIARVTDVNFSFVDDTPGEQTDSVCIHAIAEQTLTPQVKDGIRLVTLPELASMSDIQFASPVIGFGIKALG